MVKPARLEMDEEAPLKQQASKCPRCGVWSCLVRCPQCGGHKVSLLDCMDEAPRGS